MQPLSIRSAKNFMSSMRSASSALNMYLSSSSASFASVWRSANAISGSIIQNSARCREVFEFSARKVGPKVYTFDSAMHQVSTLSWPDTVRFVSRPKKSCA